MADATDLKSVIHRVCGFESRLGHEGGRDDALTEVERLQKFKVEDYHVDSQGRIY